MKLDWHVRRFGLVVVSVCNFGVVCVCVCVCEREREVKHSPRMTSQCVCKREGERERGGGKHSPGMTSQTVLWAKRQLRAVIRALHQIQVNLIIVGTYCKLVTFQWDVRDRGRGSV